MLPSQLRCWDRVPTLVNAVVAEEFWSLVFPFQVYTLIHSFIQWILTGYLLCNDSLGNSLLWVVIGNRLVIVVWATEESKLPINREKSGGARSSPAACCITWRYRHERSMHFTTRADCHYASWRMNRQRSLSAKCNSSQPGCFYFGMQTKMDLFVEGLNQGAPDGKLGTRVSWVYVMKEVSLWLGSSVSA